MNVPCFPPNEPHFMKIREKSELSTDKRTFSISRTFALTVRVAKFYPGMLTLNGKFPEDYNSEDFWKFYPWNCQEFHLSVISFCPKSGHDLDWFLEKSSMKIWFSFTYSASFKIESDRNLENSSKSSYFNSLGDDLGWHLVNSSKTVYVEHSNICSISGHETTTFGCVFQNYGFDISSFVSSIHIWWSRISRG